MGKPAAALSADFVLVSVRVAAPLQTSTCPVAPPPATTGTRPTARRAAAARTKQRERRLLLWGDGRGVRPERPVSAARLVHTLIGTFQSHIRHAHTHVQRRRVCHVMVNIIITHTTLCLDAYTLPGPSQAPAASLWGGVWAMEGPFSWGGAHSVRLPPLFHKAPFGPFFALATRLLQFWGDMGVGGWFWLSLAAISDLGPPRKALSPPPPAMRPGRGLPPCGAVEPVCASESARKGEDCAMWRSSEMVG